MEKKCCKPNRIQNFFPPLKFRKPWTKITNSKVNSYKSWTYHYKIFENVKMSKNDIVGPIIKIPLSKGKLHVRLQKDSRKDANHSLTI